MSKDELRKHDNETIVCRHGEERTVGTIVYSYENDSFSVLFLKVMSEGCISEPVELTNELMEAIALEGNTLVLNQQGAEN